MKKESLKKVIAWGAVFFTGFLIILMQQQAPVIAQGIRSGLALCGNTVIPSLFCFMVLTNFMTATRLGEYCSLPFYPIAKYIFHVDPKMGSIILMSFLGGYPIGAKAVGELVKRKQISPATANRLLSFCCNGAPSFVITAVGMGMLHRWETGLLLYCAQVISSVIIGVLVSIGKKTEYYASPAKGGLSLGDAFVDSVNFSSMTLLQMCGFILLFQAVVAVAVQLLGSSMEAVFLLGLLEVTTGCVTAAQQTGPWVLPAISFFLAFGGCSVLFQILSLLKGTGINASRFFTFRFIHGAAASGVCIILMRLFPQIAAAAHNFSSAVPVANSNTPFTTLCFMGMCSILLLNTKACCNEKILHNRRDTPK